jgi:hypothetical protein
MSECFFKLNLRKKKSPECFGLNFPESKVWWEK